MHVLGLWHLAMCVAVHDPDANPLSRLRASCRRRRARDAAERACLALNPKTLNLRPCRRSVAKREAAACAQ